MKIKITFLFLLFCEILMAQKSILPSQVFTWDKSKFKGSKIESTIIFDGKGAVLSKHQMKGIYIGSMQTLKVSKSKELERFYIVKSGLAAISLNDQNSILNRGSVICVLPGDVLEIKNNEKNPLEIYEMSYQAKEQVNIERGQKTGGSFTTHWEDVFFKSTDKGGVRQFFDRPTAMFNRFDIHVTQLNVGFKSHDPHTHANEEIILMLDGNAEMQIGDSHQKANAGDVVMLGSMVLHNLTNIGTTPCLYFAIQWN